MFEIVPSRTAAPLRGLRRQMDDLWNRFFEAPAAPSSTWPGAEGGFVPSVDVKETDKAIEVTAEIPGMKPEEIDVSLVGDLLTIKGEKKEEKEEKGENYHLLERSYGSFSRSFRLPVEVERGKVEAKHKDGVLHLVLPKGKQAATTKIKVKAD